VREREREGRGGEEREIALSQSLSLLAAAALSHTFAHLSSSLLFSPTPQYRAPLNFTPATLKAAGSSLQRIDKLVARLEAAAAAGAAAGTGDATGLGPAIESAVSAFETAMADDLNTPRAAAALFGLVGAAEKALAQTLDAALAEQALAALRRLDRVLGVLYVVPAPPGYFGETAGQGQASGGSASASASASAAGAGASAAPIELASLPAEVLALTRQRAELKAAKEYAQADEVRAQLAAMGFVVKDKAGGLFDVFRL